MNPTSKLQAPDLHLTPAALIPVTLYLPTLLPGPKQNLPAFPISLTPCSQWLLV